MPPGRSFAHARRCRHGVRQCGPGHAVEGHLGPRHRASRHGPGMAVPDPERRRGKPAPGRPGAAGRSLRAGDDPVPARRRVGRCGEASTIGGKADLSGTTDTVFSRPCADQQRAAGPVPTVRGFGRWYWLFLAINRRRKPPVFCAARHWPRRPFGPSAQVKAARRSSQPPGRTAGCGRTASPAAAPPWPTRSLRGVTTPRTGRPAGSPGTKADANRRDEGVRLPARAGVNQALTAESASQAVV
jgi:hypothetical protein